MENGLNFKERFPSWFGIAALIFGTFCGANMASGVYASAYIVTLGGGWALVWLFMIFAFMSFFSTLSLNFIRVYKASDYNEFYLALYGQQEGGKYAKPVYKRIVSIFFDLYTLFMGIITVAATLALFSQLMNELLNIPIIIARIGGVILFAILTMWGAGFLRKFNTVMTLSLLASLVAILIGVIIIRGDVLISRIGDFNTGLDWTGESLKGHFFMIFAYSMGMSSWGGTLSNYAERINDRKDAIGAGLTIGILVTVLWSLTSAIVLPFMPEVYGGTPILMISMGYLGKAMTSIYWVVVVLSVVSTGPTFTFNVANRFSKVWKSEKVSQRGKFFVIALIYLLVSWAISNLGLMFIVQKGYTAAGQVALFAIVIPLLFSVYRVKKREEIKAENN